MIALTKAHQQAALLNNNVSSVALKLASSVGTPFSQSVASALITLGGEIHGPTTLARQVIYSWSKEDIEAYMAKGKRIPGWGNNFFKDKIDPAWDEMFRLLKEDYYPHFENLVAVSSVVNHCSGRYLYPNAAAFTAITAEILELIPGTEIMLAIVCRLPAWATQYAEQKRC